MILRDKTIDGGFKYFNVEDLKTVVYLSKKIMTVDESVKTVLIFHKRMIRCYSPKCVKRIC